MASAKFLRTQRLIFQLGQVVGIPFVFHRQNANSPQNIYACDYKDDPCLVNNGRMFQESARGDGCDGRSKNNSCMGKGASCKVEGKRNGGGCMERSILEGNADGCGKKNNNACGRKLEISSSCEVKKTSCGGEKKKERRSCGRREECDSSSLTMHTKVKLREGCEIPLFGLGTIKVKKDKHEKDEMSTEESVLCALQHGYRLIDTAEFYGNENEVGRAIAKSGVPREEIYLVTKLWTKGYDECKKAFNNSLKNLDTDYVDLYLIHVPTGGLNCESYDAMVELQKEGCIRSIGVANFGVCHLQELQRAGKPTPEVNQIELHCFCKQNHIVDYCRKNNITVMGYRPLAKGKFFNHPCIKEMAQKYKKDEAQIMLRWSVQKGYVTIPRAHQPQDIETNADIFDFCISDKDMKTLDNLPEDCVTDNPVNAPWEG